MTSPAETFGPMFDNFRAEMGEFPIMASRFSADDLVPEESVSDAIRIMHQIDADPATLERWAEQRWCAWLPLPETEPARRGLPVYVLDRLALFHELTAKGWTTAELAAYAEYEDGYVEDILRQETVLMPSKADEGLAAVLTMLRDELRRYEDEIGARRPHEAWPEGWHWRSRSSDLMALDLTELERRQQGVARLVARLEQTGWTGIHPERAESLRRHAFVSAMWGECIDVLLLEKERAPLRAGVSWFLGLTRAALEAPEPALDADPEGWVERLRVDWAEVLAHPWCDEHGEELPIRLPGVVITGGQFQHASHPAGFADLYRRWNLGSYKELHAAHAGHRICAQCHVRIEGPPSKRFCSPACNGAHRQAEHRHRQAERRKAVASHPERPNDPEAA